MAAHNPFRVFENRDYALYFGGQLISQVGTWMQQIALSWLTYRLTSSPLLLAVVAVSSQLPSLLVMPFAGVLADRFNRHRIVVLTQVFAMVQAAILAFLTLNHMIQVWHLIALGILMGFINAFDLPVRSAFVIDMVQKKEDLPAAIAMNSSLMNVSRLLGPALAGFVVASLGEGSLLRIEFRQLHCCDYRLDVHSRKLRREEETRRYARCICRIERRLAVHVANEPDSGTDHFACTFRIWWHGIRDAVTSIRQRNRGRCEHSRLLKFRFGTGLGYWHCNPCYPQTNCWSWAVGDREFVCLCHRAADFWFRA